MENREIIEHRGVITKITDHYLQVNLESISACGACHAKGYCSVSETDNKIVEIENTGRVYHTGEEVVVMLDHSQGIKATVLGYIVPFLLVFIVLITALSLTGNEPLSGLLAVGSLVPYYLLLYVLRHSFRKQFTFSLKSIQKG